MKPSVIISIEEYERLKKFEDRFIRAGAFHQRVLSEEKLYARLAWDRNDVLVAQNAVLHGNLSDEQRARVSEILV